MNSKSVLSVAAAALGFVLMATSAHALSVSPGGDLGIDFSDVTPRANSNCNLDCLTTQASQEGITIGAVSLVNDLYTINITDSTFTVAWNGGQSAGCPECYLYVKDGNHQPYAYLFDISTWNGTTTITGSGFWEGQGGISHVDLYAGSRVPEPTSLLLLGAGLAGLGIWRWKQA